MKNFVILTALFGLMLLFVGYARAIPPLPPDAGSRLEHALNLTDIQKRQLKPLLRWAHAQVMNIRNDSFLTRTEKYQRLRSLRIQTREEINQILTPEQQAQLNYLRQQARQSRLNAAMPQQQVQSP